MRLKSHLPSLPPRLHPLLPLLSSIQIAQSQTLLFTPPTEILSLLPSDSGFALKDIEQLQNVVLKLESPPFQKGGVLLEHEKKMSLKKKGMWAGVGEKGLDGLLEGVGDGVGGGLVEISGEGATKSLICLHIVINHLIHNPTTKALWIDTEGEFSGEKALAVLETKQSDLDTTSVLDRLVIQRMFDLPPFSELVSKLHLDLAEPAPEDDNQQQQQGGPQKHRSQGFSLLVVDSITSLYENFIATAELEGRASLISHLHYLSTLSKSYPLLTILTNHSIPISKNPNNPHSQPYPFPSRISRTNTRPALDSVFSHLTDLTLWLELPAGYAAEGGRDGWVVFAQVLRNRIGRSGTFSAFYTNGTELRTHASFV